MNVYKTVFRAFEKEKVKYLIVGGVAVNLYGYSRFTGDIDILLALDRRNLAKIDKVMNKLGYIECLPVKIQELGDKKKLKGFIEQKGLEAYTFINEKRPQFSLDIIVGRSLEFKKFDKNKTLVEVWDLRLPVVSIDDLIGMKKEAGRDQDLIDLEALLNLKEL